MSRKLSIGVITGVVVAVAAAHWFSTTIDDGGPPDGVARIDVAGTTALPNKQVVDERSHYSDWVNREETGFTQQDFRLIGESVRFTIGDRCDGQEACRRGPVPLHEYAQYTDDDLKVLAEFDGAAAIVLANRLGPKDRGNALKYAARGFVMTGDPYAFHMTRSFSGVSTGANYDSSGQLDIAAARRAYVWLKLGYELGVGDTNRLRYQASILSANGVDDLSRLDTEAAVQQTLIEDARLRLVGEGFK